MPTHLPARKTATRPHSMTRTFFSLGFASLKTEETKGVYELTRQETQAHKPTPLGPLEDCVRQSLSSCIFSSTRLLAINLLALPRLSGSSVTSCPSLELPWVRELLHSLISFFSFLYPSVHSSVHPSVHPESHYCVLGVIRRDRTWPCPDGPGCALSA